MKMKKPYFLNIGDGNCMLERVLSHALAGHPFQELFISAQNSSERCNSLIG